MAKLNAHGNKILWQVYRSTTKPDSTFIEFIALRSDRKLLYRSTTYSLFGHMTARERWRIYGRLNSAFSPDDALHQYRLDGWLKA